MSALGQKQTCAVHQPMSALLPIATAKADIPWWIGEASACRHSGAACDARQASSRPTKQPFNGRRRSWNSGFVVKGLIYAPRGRMPLAISNPRQA